MIAMADDDLSPIPIAPLAAAVHGIGRYRTAHNVEDLAYMLLNLWPADQRGDAWIRAQTACLEALTEQSGGDAARDAFIEAAAEAGISTMPGQVPPPKRPASDKKRR
jgi:hypothetical protein